MAISFRRTQLTRSALVVFAGLTSSIVASSGNNPVASTLCDDLKSFSPSEFRSYPVTKITQLSHNTKAFVCALPSPEHETGMPVSSCIMIKNAATPPVAKPYTPTTLTDEKGHFELVVKAYPDGKVSGYLHSLKVGDTIEVKGN
jgi:cytochrome-b5 reductase